MMPNMFLGPILWLPFLTLVICCSTSEYRSLPYNYEKENLAVTNMKSVIYEREIT